MIPPAPQPPDIGSPNFIEEMTRELWEVNATLEQFEREDPTQHWDELHPETAEHWRTITRAALTFLSLYGALRYAPPLGRPRGSMSN